MRATTPQRPGCCGASLSVAGALAMFQDVWHFPSSVMRATPAVMQWNIPNILSVGRLIAAPCLALVFVFFSGPTAVFIALALFVGASLTDWVDGYLARKWNQTSKFGAMIDPIADKAMVIIALGLIMGLSRLSPAIVAPTAFILFREVFVSGLREFLGADAGSLKVTKLAKWKTTVQMVAITLLFLSFGFQAHHDWLYFTFSPDDYEAAMAAGADGGATVWKTAQAAWWSGILGIILIWAAALLTVVTGWDYFSKALPYLKEDDTDA